MKNLPLTLQVNGREVQVGVEARETLLDVLRDRLGLTGAHGACEQGACGACTVLLDGRAVQSCLVLGVQADGCDVRTVEGVSAPGSLHPLQDAMHRLHALQCWFCTPGIVMAALELLESGAKLDRAGIESAMSGNLCRCTGYQPIVDAIAELAAVAPASPEDPVIGALDPGRTT